MSRQSDSVLTPDAFFALLDDSAIPPVVMPLICACATEEGQIVWKGTQSLPREADVTASLLERKAAPAWREAVKRSIGLYSLAEAVGRYLASPTMEQAAPPRDPADFILAATAEALGGESIADAWFRGSPESLARLQRFLTAVEAD